MTAIDTRNLKLGFGKLASGIHCESQALDPARLLSKTELDNGVNTTGLMQLVISNG